MPLYLFNDQLDEAPEKETSEGFSGMDAVSKPTLLLPGQVRAGSNMWMDVDGIVRTRPGLRFNALCNTLPLVAGARQIQGLGYFDTVANERILAVRNGKLYEILSAGNAATVNELAGPTPSTSADVQFAQLVDRMFYQDGVLRWSLNSAGWTHGSVTTFSDASAMPTWKLIGAHRFRMLAVDADGIRLYASAVGQAHNAADWVRTDNIRVGDGEGDPITAIISGTSYLTVLCERSAYQVDTSAASLANWSIRKITDLGGCCAGKTALSIGQDIIFLSRYGVTNLGALADTISINPATLISAAVQFIIDRINWTAIGTAWATSWRDLYILALPLGSDTSPNTLLTFNTRTGQWATPWASTLATADLGSGNFQAFTGWAGAVVTRFGQKQETLLADTCGRLLRMDDSYERDDNTAANTNLIVSYVTLRGCAFGAPEAFKQPFWLEIEFFNSTGAGVQLNLVRDGLQAFPDRTLPACEIIATGLETNNLRSFPIVFPLQFQPNEAFYKTFVLRGQGRFRQATIQAVATSGAMKIRSATFAAFVDTPQLTT